MFQPCGEPRVVDQHIDLLNGVEVFLAFRLRPDVETKGAAGGTRLLDLPAEGFQPVGPASRGDDVVTQCGEPQRGRPADAGCGACDDSLFFHKRLSSIPEQK